MRSRNCYVGLFTTVKYGPGAHFPWGSIYNLTPVVDVVVVVLVEVVIVLIVSNCVMCDTLHCKYNVCSVQMCNIKGIASYARLLSIQYLVASSRHSGEREVMETLHVHGCKKNHWCFSLTLLHKKSYCLCLDHNT